MQSFFDVKDLKAVGVGQSKASALMLENKPKNRYNNVLPCEFTTLFTCVFVFGIRHPRQE